MKRIYLVLFLGLILMGCGGKKTEEHRHEGHSQMDHSKMQHSKMDHSMPEKRDTSTTPEVIDYQPASEEIGTEAVCVVMNNKFKIGKNTKAVMYKGNKYYFCCPGCEPMFKKDPEKYAE